MDAWLHSTGHRENILTPDFRELGVGYLSNQSFQGYRRRGALVTAVRRAHGCAGTGRDAEARREEEAPSQTAGLRHR